MPIVNLYDNNHTGSVAQITFTSNLGGAPYVIGTFQIPYAFDSNILPGGYYFGTYSLFYSQWGQTCTIQILPPDSPTPTPTNTQTPTQTPTQTSTNTSTPTQTPTQTTTVTPNLSPSQTPTHTPTVTTTPTNTNTPTNTTTKTPTQTKTPTNTTTPTITPTNTTTPTITPTNTTSPTQTSRSCFCSPPSVLLPDKSGCILSATTGATQISTLSAGDGTPNSAYGNLGARIYNLGGFAPNGDVIGNYAAEILTPAGGGPSPITPNAAFWGNENNNTGRLNEAEIWVTGQPFWPDPNYPGTLYVCDTIYVPNTKVYYIGCGGDNQISITANTTTILTQDGSEQKTSNFNYWHIYPVLLNAGFNNIIISNTNLGSVGGFAAEIYDNTLAELQAATSTNMLNILFTTADFRTGGPREGEAFCSSFTCPDGFFYDSQLGLCVQQQITNCVSCCAPQITNVTQTNCDKTVTIDFTIPSCASPCTTLIVERSFDNISWSGVSFGSCVSPKTFNNQPYQIIYWRMYSLCGSQQSPYSNVVSTCIECYLYRFINNGLTPANFFYFGCNDETCTQITVVVPPNSQTGSPICAKAGSVSSSGGSIAIVNLGRCGTAQCPCDIVFEAIRNYY